LVTQEVPPARVRQVEGRHHRISWLVADCSKEGLNVPGDYVGGDTSQAASLVDGERVEVEWESREEGMAEGRGK
jgi:hypothetical protein